MKSTLFFVLSLSAQFHGVESFWRMICDKPIVTARIDPIISPGAISAHTHSVTGASNVFYGATYDDLRKSDCTTCQVTQDHSAYWVPQLYYTHQNGTYEAVGMTGGLTVYYLPRGQPGPAGKILAMPNGLRMIAGDPFRRSYNSSDVSQRAIGFSCLGGVGYTKSLQEINNCPNGLRAEVFFPNCWDGINLDSADHSSHMAYSGDDGNGACPSSHPVKLVSIFYEAMWGIDHWKNDWWNGTAPPFVFAQGDPTGYGSHGDFMSGWEESFLQTAVDTCTNDSGLIQDCAVFNIDKASASSCKWAGSLLTSEEVLGAYGGLATLPGCNPVTYGPDEAPIHPSICPNGANNIVQVPSSTPIALAASAKIVAASTPVGELVSPSALVKAENRILSLSSVTTASSSATNSVVYSNSTGKSTTFSVVTTTQLVTATVNGQSTVYTSTIMETSSPTQTQATAAISSTNTGAVVPVSSFRVAAGNVQLAGTSGQTTGTGGVNVVEVEVIEYYTITTILYESSTPFVQLYVVPASVTSLLDITSTQSTTVVSPTDGPQTITSTVFETVKYTTYVPPPTASLASMDVLQALPSMVAYHNSTVGNDTNATY